MHRAQSVTVEIHGRRFNSLTEAAQRLVLTKHQVQYRLDRVAGYVRVGKPPKPEPVKEPVPEKEQGTKPLALAGSRAKQQAAKTRASARAAEVTLPDSTGRC